MNDRKALHMILDGLMWGIVFIVVLTILCMVIEAKASPGAMCVHTYECHDARLVCVADCPMCSIGHCAAVRVLW